MKVSLVSHEAVVRALDAASSIEMSAYRLAPGTRIVKSLERAADRGARVELVMEGSPYGGRAAKPGVAGAGVAAELRRHGVRVRMSGAGDAPMHLKAAICDGTAFLDDRNWPERGPDTVVATRDTSAVAAVKSALAGTPVSTGSLATEKRAALALEAATISEARGDRIDVQSESFDPSAVSAALRERASHGAHVRLIVSARDYAGSGSSQRTALQHLAADGVDVRLSSSAEKLCVAGESAWIGSANATFEKRGERMFDWGVRTQQPLVTAALEAEFERNWSSASPLATVHA